MPFSEWTIPLKSNDSKYKRTSVQIILWSKKKDMTGEWESVRNFVTRIQAWIGLKSTAWNAEFSLCIVIQRLCGLEQKCLLAAWDVTQSIVWLFMPDERQTSMLHFFHGCCTGYRAESSYSISTKPSAQRFPTITFALPFSLSQRFVYNRWLRQSSR